MLRRDIKHKRPIPTGKGLQGRFACGCRRLSMQLMGVATIGSPLGTVLVQTGLLERMGGSYPFARRALGDLFEEPFEHFRTHGILQFCYGFGFDLPYAFAGDFEYPADFLQGVRVPIG